jgi:hypothetical protein
MMKSPMKIGIILLSFGILMIYGCKKDSTEPGAKFSASIDSVAWNAGVRVTIKKEDGFYITGTQITSSLKSSSLVIKVFGFSTGTYNVVASDNNCAALYTPNLSTPSDSYASLTGTVNLTEVNTTAKTISGTFSFSCVNTALAVIPITNGSFTGLKYTE